MYKCFEVAKYSPGNKIVMIKREKSYPIEALFANLMMLVLGGGGVLKINFGLCF